MASTAAPKVPVYSGNDLKNTTDDALTPYLTTLPQPYTFTKDNTNSNVRFIIGYTAVAIAGATFYVDRILGWEATEAPWVSVAVVSYFILNSILTYWIWAVEAGEVFRGKRKSGETIVIRSSSKKHSPLYKLKVKYTSPANKVLQEKEIEAPFTMWFSSDGVFHPEPFRRWLASEIEILGLAAKEAAKKTGGLSSHVGIDEQSRQTKGGKK
ncbi:hypothetical protein VTN96DRAFT_5776 [Rasamsonia emersonii]